MTVSYAEYRVRSYPLVDWIDVVFGIVRATSTEAVE